MGRFDALFSRDMAVSTHEVSWVGEYVSCGCATAYYTPLFNVSGQKVVVAYTNK